MDSTSEKEKDSRGRDKREQTSSTKRKTPEKDDWEKRDKDDDRRGRGKDGGEHGDRRERGKGRDRGKGKGDSRLVRSNQSQNKTTRGGQGERGIRLRSKLGPTISTLERLMISLSIYKVFKEKKHLKLNLDELKVDVYNGKKQYRVYDLWFLRQEDEGDEVEDIAKELTNSWLFKGLQMENSQSCIFPAGGQGFRKILKDSVEEESQFCIFVLSEKKPTLNELTRYYEPKPGGKEVLQIKEISEAPSMLVKKFRATNPFNKEYDNQIWLVRFNKRVDFIQKTADEFYGVQGGKRYFSGPLIAKAWYPFYLKYIVAQFNVCRALRTFTRDCKKGEKRAGYCHCRMNITCVRGSWEVFWPTKKHQRNCNGQLEEYKKSSHKGGREFDYDCFVQ